MTPEAPGATLRGRIPRDLAVDAAGLIGRIRAAADPTALRPEGIELVMRLTAAGLDHFFLRAVRELGLGRMAETTTRLGLKTAHGGIGMFVRRLAGGLDGDQMLRLAEIVEEMIVPEDSGI